MDFRGNHHFRGQPSFLGLHRASNKVVDGEDICILADETIKMVVTGLEISY